MRPEVGGVARDLDGSLAGSAPDELPGAWLCGDWDPALACAGASAPAGCCVPVSRAAAPRAWKTGTGECLAGEGNSDTCRELWCRRHGDVTPQ